MSIVAECPHCETRFNLQPDLVGKSMRCPNLDCRQVFVVQPVKPAGATPPPKAPAAPPRGNASGSVEDFVPVVDAEVVKPAPKAKKRDARPAKPAPGPQPEVVEAAVVSPPPKEVVWSDQNAPPPPTKRPTRAATVADEADDRPVVRRQRKKKKSHTTLILVLLGLVIGGGAAAYGAYVYITGLGAKNEATAAQEAKGEFDKGSYTTAAKQFEKLAEDFSESPDRAKYQFYADLSGLQAAAGSAGNRNDPMPVVGRLRAFVEANKDSPFTKPDEGAGKHVYDAGRRVIDDLIGHVQDRIQAYKSDRSKPDELANVEKTIASGQELVALVTPFRPADASPLDPQLDGLNKARGDIDWERKRLEVLAQARERLKTPTEAAIETTREDFAGHGLTSDPEAGAMVKDAEGAFLRRIKYEPDPAAPQTPRPTAAASLLFVAPVGATRPPPKDAAASEPAVFLAVARGILYAIDEESGNLIWAARVGDDVKFPPAVATVDVDGTPTELAVVASNVGGEPGLTGYVLKTGQPRWFQALPAPPAGPAAVVGGRAFVPLRDPLGTISEVNLVTGERVGRIALGQPIAAPPLGAGIAVRPGTGMLYVAADSRRVFVIDVGTKPDEAERVLPRCVQVFVTGHTPGTVRVPPVVIDPDGAGPAGGWMILVQTEQDARLRAYPLPPPAAGEGPAEVAPAAEADLPLPGWVQFAPASDGERLALVTDRGQLRLFGVNQPGNLDRALFPLPSPALPTPGDDKAVPGVVVPAEEAAFLVVANTRLQKLRLALIPSREYAAVPEGKVVPLGQPSQPPQLNRRRDAAFLVVRSADSAGMRAVLVNLRDGEVRWKRQLGVIPTEAPLAGADALTLVDEDGGVLTLPPAAAEVPAGAAKTISAESVAVGQPENVTGRTAVAASADGKVIYTVTPVEAGGTARFAVRRVANGKLEHSGSVAAPGSLAGSPAVLGNALIFPSSDGFVYRHVPGDGKNKPDTLTAGPRWADDRRDPRAVCFITPVSATAFLTSDGGRKLTRWDWPAGAGYKPGGATWEVRERVAIPPLLLPPTAGGVPARLLVADVTGSVWLYPAERGGAPLRRWRPDGVTIPDGTPTGRFAVQSDADGRQRVAYAVGVKAEGADRAETRHVVGLDPDRDAALWVARSSEDAGGALVGSPQPAGDGRWLVTDLAGRVLVLDPETGKPVVTREVGLPGAVPGSPAVTAGPGRVLCPLSDGSAAVIVLSPGGAEPK